MSVLVTGGGGFLGRYLVEQLVERGESVRTVSRRQYPELESLGVQQVSHDLRDPSGLAEICREMDTVYHTAGVAGIWGKWSHFYGINTIGTRNLLAASQEAKVSKFVYSSSPSVTFDGSEQCHIDESVPYASRWLCHYPHSKALAEQEVLAANGNGGLATCALRPHLIWGPRDQHLIPRLLRRAASGQLRRVGDGSNLIDMVYVENAAEAHVQAAQALDSPRAVVAGRAYFISQGEPVNCWDWINEILGLAQLPPVEKSISFRAAWAIGAGLEGLHLLRGSSVEPRMTRFLAAQLAKSHYFNIQRARDDFGFAPRIPTDDAMRRLANACGTG